MEQFETGANKLTFNQLIARSIVKAVLPDVPPVRDINTIARAFDLPIPQGEELRGIKLLIKAHGLGRFLAYLQKAYAITKNRKQPMSWDAYTKVQNGYLALAHMKSEY